MLVIPLLVVATACVASARPQEREGKMQVGSDLKEIVLEVSTIT